MDFSLRLTVEPDTMGIARYFHVEYKIGNKTLSVKRTAQSLILVLKKLEDEQAKISDSLFWCVNNKDSGEIRRPVKVTVQDVTEEKSDL